MGKTSYKLIARKNPVTKEFAYHAQQVRYSQIKAEDIVDYAAKNSCIDRAMIQTVMTAWQQVMRMYFVNGHNVTCYPLGSFISTIRSAGSASVDTFDAATLIKGMYMTFRPCRPLRLAKALKNNSFSRVATVKAN